MYIIKEKNKQKIKRVAELVGEKARIMNEKKMKKKEKRWEERNFFWIFAYDLRDLDKPNRRLRELEVYHFRTLKQAKEHAKFMKKERDYVMIFHGKWISTE